MFSYFLIYFFLRLLKLNIETLLICHRYLLTENNFFTYAGISDKASCNDIILGEAYSNHRKPYLK